MMNAWLPSFFVLLLWTNVCWAVATGPNNSTNSVRLVRCLKAIPVPANDAHSDKPHLVLPADALYPDEKQGFQLRVPRFPYAIYYPRTPANVQSAVNCARTNKVPIVPRGGGHSYEALSSLTNGLVIDVLHMDQVRSISQVDSNNAIATVRAGIRLGYLYTELWKRGEWTFNAGTCPNVGLAGHISSGGWGLNGRKYALAADRVESMRVVLANGSIVTADAKTNSDLFWALRGGGAGSFGIIVEFKLKVFKMPVSSMVAIEWNQADIPYVMDRWLKWGAQAPRELSLQLWTDKDWASFQTRGHYLGPLSKLRALLNESQLLVNATRVVTTDKCNGLGTRLFAWGDYTCSDYNQLLPGGRDTNEGKFKSGYLSKPLPLAGYKTIQHYLKIAPVGSSFQFKVYGSNSAMTDYADTALPFPNRQNTLAHMEFFTPVKATDPLDHPNYKWLNDFYNAIKPYANGRAYQGYADLFLGEPEVYGKAYWGPNFARLIRIKNKYDKNNGEMLGGPFDVRKTDGVSEENVTVSALQPQKSAAKQRDVTTGEYLQIIKESMSDLPFKQWTIEAHVAAVVNSATLPIDATALRGALEVAFSDVHRDDSRLGHARNKAKALAKAVSAAFASGVIMDQLESLEQACRTVVLNDLAVSHLRNNCYDSLISSTGGRKRKRNGTVPEDKGKRTKIEMKEAVVGEREEVEEREGGEEPASEAACLIQDANADDEVEVPIANEKFSVVPHQPPVSSCASSLSPTTTLKGVWQVINRPKVEVFARIAQHLPQSTSDIIDLRSNCRTLYDLPIDIQDEYADYMALTYDERVSDVQRRFLADVFDTERSNAEWVEVVATMQLPDDDQLKQLARIIRQTLPAFIKAFSLGSSNPLVQTSTLECSLLNTYIHPIIAATLWEICKIDYTYGDIPDRLFDRKKADGVGKMINADKYPLVYVEGSRIEPREGKEESDAEKVAGMMVRVQERILKGLVKGRRRVPGEVATFGVQCVGMQLRFLMLDYHGEPFL
ncbi:hypothetical protein HK097_003889 [Rhizophlyctis rosea]|uniref:FAD-binding PCMH-type domain-containing protein n=1 Tax=Rhizophlyctis rosea TaxID=64517 RepID=A0AAD5X637_9FUNG|nr:hypothetical protein HK097_003889 [Rhizophlyctis rosea]